MIQLLVSIFTFSKNTLFICNNHFTTKYTFLLSRYPEGQTACNLENFTTQDAKRQNVKNYF